MPDWTAIKAEYIAGGTSYRKLAEKYHLNVSAIYQKAKSENWQELKAETKNRVEAQLIQKTADEQSEMAVVRTRVSQKIMRYIDQCTDDIIESGDGIRYLKDITTAFKTIVEIIDSHAEQSADDPIMLLLERLNHEADSQQ